ncbi:nucleotidyl transferase AbiEii/AbiGii toxin family protein [Bacteroides sp. 51]|uniref:nucleotidyl transferase AbiEii/AbiGii toxin family protein n=1 Tax=Bacteroides sp. 51 TaxID=2302938 RepID=UPI0013D37DDC|nr:nucleotidyl transferase AbiEii/AbiGii toxin family protein [Bacteroides sp. 51]NDV83807.1 hypothetical protein [Bacteroides sp. 51]
MLHYSTVDTATLELLRKLQKIPCLQHTRLVGGTALALQIGHRKSIDIDLFGGVTADPDTLVEELSTIGDLKILKNFSNIRIFLLDDVKVDIVNYRYPWLMNAIYDDDVTMASLEDICAMKLAAVTGRGTKKDFVDIYFLLQRYSLEQMLSYYLSKYADGSDFTVLKSLSYFDDAEIEPMPYMLENVSWEVIKKTIEDALF